MAVIGVGNALTDIIITLDSIDVIKDMKLEAGGMYLLDSDKHHQVADALRHMDGRYVAGGSAANAIGGIAQLGASAAYVGHIGLDNTGAEFRKCQQQSGIISLLGISESTPSGQCISLVTPDGERTMLTYLGAALEIGTEHLTPDNLLPHKVMLIEGYLLNCPQVIEPAMRRAKEHGLSVAMDAASFTVINEHRDYANLLIDKYVDILLANEDEATALTGESDPQAALERLAPRCDYVVVKVGKSGSLIAHGPADRYRIGVVDAVVRDKTGAGDLYAAGFLYGFCKGLDLEKCGDIGAIVSSRSIEYLGAQIPPAAWQLIRADVARVESGQKIVTLFNVSST